MRSTSEELKYVNDTFTLVDEDLARIKGVLKAKDLDFMSVSLAEGRILQFLIKSFNIRNVVEVGALFGFSAVCMAKALPVDGKLIALEKSPEYFEMTKMQVKLSGVEDKVEVLNGDAEELLSSLTSRGPFDMIFIDANKAAYTKYLDWAEKNIRRGGLIVGDNTFLFGALWDKSKYNEVGEKQVRVMSDFNRRLADQSKYNSILIPTGEGLTVAQVL